MIELIDKFTDYFKNVGYSDMISNSILKSGIYIKINKDNSFTKLIINKSYEKNLEEDKELYEWFRIRKFYSTSIIFDNHKTKKEIKSFLNQNYLSLYFNYKDSNKKNETKNSIEPKPDIIDSLPTLQQLFFNKLMENVKNQQLEKENYKKHIPSNGNPVFRSTPDFDMNEFVIYKEKWQKIMPLLQEELKKEKVVLDSDTNVVGVFWDNGNIDSYKAEFERALYINSYISKNGVFEENGELFVFPPRGNTLNSKKPMLSNTGCIDEIPFYIPLNEALMFKRMELYFVCMAINNKVKEIYVNDNSHFEDINSFTKEFVQEGSYSAQIYKIGNNVKGIDILYSNTVIFKNDKTGIEYPNFMNIKGEDGSIKHYEDITISRLKSQTASVFFSTNNSNIFDSDKKSIVTGKSVPSRLKDILIITKDFFKEFFDTGNTIGLKYVINKYSIPIIMNQLVLSDYDNNAAEAFNLRMCYLNYINKGAESMKNINELSEKVKDIIENNEGIKEDKQFWFLTGQVFAYLAKQSKKESKKHELYMPILNVNTVDIVKRKVLQYYETYGYGIFIGYKRIENAISLIMAYEPINKKSNKEMLLAGLLSESLFWKEKEDIIKDSTEKVS